MGVLTAVGGGAHLALMSDTWSVIWPRALEVPRMSLRSFPAHSSPTFPASSRIWRMACSPASPGGGGGRGQVGFYGGFGGDNPNERARFVTWLSVGVPEPVFSLGHLGVDQPQSPLHGLRVLFGGIKEKNEMKEMKRKENDHGVIPELAACLKKNTLLPEPNHSFCYLVAVQHEHAVHSNL